MKKKMILGLIVTFLMMFLSSNLSLAYTDYHQIESPNGDTYGVSGRLKENDTSTRYMFYFTGIEVLPLSQYKPSNSEVASFVKQLVSYDCYIEFDKMRNGPNNTIQAYVWIEKPEGNVTEAFVKANLVNAMLVEKGYARVLDYGPNQKYTSYLLKLEEKAKNSHLGIWK